MKLCILYHPDSDQATPVEQFANQLAQRSNQKVDLVSLESREGASMARLYDVMDYPAFLVVREDDHSLNMEWEGTKFPQVDEVIGYLI